MYFRGKQSDSSEAILRICLDRYVHTGISHVNCLTGRPFARRYPLSHPPLWFAPFIDPWNGLLSAFSALGIRQYARTHLFAAGAPTNPSQGDEFGRQLDDLLTQWLQVDAVILGPLDRRVLWNTLESRYYGGTAHFVFVYATAGIGRFRVHDPEGRPCSSVSAMQLATAQVGAPSPTGLTQITNQGALRPWKEVLIHTVRTGIQIYSTAVDFPEAGPQGLASLVDQLRTKPLKTSERGSLHYALTYTMLAVQDLARLFTDSTWEYFIGQAAYESSLHEWRRFARYFCRTCATALDGLHRGDQPLLLSSLEDVTNWETNLGTLLETSVDLLPQVE